MGCRSAVHQAQAAMLFSHEVAWCSVPLYWFARSFASAVGSIGDLGGGHLWYGFDLQYTLPPFVSRRVIIKPLSRSMNPNRANFHECQIHPARRASSH